MSATRHNAGKLRWSLLPAEGVEPIVRVLMHGAGKYGDHNWRKGMGWTETYDSTQRHLQDWLRGEDLDKDSGLPNLAHAGCNIVFLLAYAVMGVGTDDRWRKA